MEKAEKGVVRVTEPIRISTVDLGTNTVKATHGSREANGTLTDMVHTSDTIRLGQDIEQTGMIMPDRIDLCMAFLNEQERIGRETGSTAFVGVATEALRVASNGSELRERIARETNWQIEIISGSEEARLTYIGLKDQIPAGQSCAVVDIGGGSTEIVLVSDTGDVTFQRSVPIGSGRLADRHFAADPPGPEAVALALRDASEEFSDLDRADVTPTLVLLAGGSGLFMSQLVALLFPGETFTASINERLLHYLATHPSRETVGLIDIPEARAKVLPASVAIALAFMLRSGGETARGVPSGIRMGLMREYRAD